MAGTRLEIGRTDAAIETPDRFLVDRVDSRSGAFALAAFANSKGRRPQGSGPAVYERNHWRTKGRCDQPPQRRRKRLAVPATAGRARDRRDPRVAAVLSQFRIDRHTLVSAHRRRAHCDLSQSAGSRKDTQR